MSLLGYILGTQGQLEITNTLEDLGRVAREFKTKGISTLAINGGDGTVCRTLTAFINEYGSTPLPQIALLRGGTINMLAGNLGIKGSPEQVLFRLVEWHASGEPFSTRRLKSLHIEGNYGFLFGNGVAASFLKEYYRRKTGPFGAFLWVMSVYASRFFGGGLFDRVVQDHHQLLYADGGQPISHSTVAVFCATVPKLPLGYPLFSSLKGQPDCFQCVSFTVAARDVVWQLPVTLLKRQDGSTKGKMSLCCRELVIEADAPFDYTLDGELYVSRTSRLFIGTGPDLEFVTI